MNKTTQEIADIILKELAPYTKLGNVYANEIRLIESILRIIEQTSSIAIKDVIKDL